MHAAEMLNKRSWTSQVVRSRDAFSRYKRRSGNSDRYRVSDALSNLHLLEPESLEKRRQRRARVGRCGRQDAGVESGLPHLMLGLAPHFGFEVRIRRGEQARFAGVD